MQSNCAKKEGEKKKAHGAEEEGGKHNERLQKSVRVQQSFVMTYMATPTSLPPRTLALLGRISDLNLSGDVAMN